MAILPAGQRRLWPELAPLSGLGWVLYGGTAVALRLGHRSSVDFDFFSDQALDRGNLERRLPFLARATTIQEEPNTLSVLVPMPGEPAPVKLSFFGGLGFGRVGVPDRTSDGVAEVASIDDLLAMKLKVILQRAEAKDYLDIARLLGADARLDYGLAAARTLFGPAFQPSESLKALTFFEDGNLGALPERERELLTRAASSVRALPPVALASRTLASA